jgi:hypothetical protein
VERALLPAAFALAFDPALAFDFALDLDPEAALQSSEVSVSLVVTLAPRNTLLLSVRCAERIGPSQGASPNPAGVNMFARKVSVRLKPDSLGEFASLIECKILPWLRRQEGFLDLIILALPNGSEVATISFWDHEANAQSYNSSGYPEVVQILEELLDGIPYVKTFEVVSSTLRQLTRVSRPDVENLAPDSTSAPGYPSHETNA